MDKLNLRQINIFLLRYRKILIALLVSFLVWNLTQNAPPGKTVLIAREFIPANAKLSQNQFLQIQISGLDTENFLTEFVQVEAKYAKRQIPIGSLISKNSIKTKPDLSTRIDVFVSLENTDQIAPGTPLHLWAISDQFKKLVSTDAIVRSATYDNFKTHLKVSIPLLDEYEVMQANEIKVSIVN